MDLNLVDMFVETDQGRDASTIIQKCVHCGFCNATCPTYQLFGDELDGPRGRIYLIKSMLEGHEVSASTQIHLDRCLTCRSCETTCPSGVEFGQLLEIGREVVEEKSRRPVFERLARFTLRKVLSRHMLFGSRLFGCILLIGRILRPIMPRVIARQFGVRRIAGRRPEAEHSRRMLILDGCVQQGFAPIINAAACRVLDRAGISMISVGEAGCCGALSLHLAQAEEARQFMRRNIDAWWPEIERGCEAIAITASGCGVTIREYGRLLASDEHYAQKAARVSALTRDLSEIVVVEKPAGLPTGDSRLVSYHSPCTLQHGQQIHGLVEEILASYGWQVATVRDGHLCCGSAGTYSLFHPRIAEQLVKDKLVALEEPEPEVIASANIGCLMHIGAKSTVSVRHWIELLDPEAPPT